MLKDKASLFANVSTMRQDYKKEAARVATAAEAARRASVEAIESAEKFRVTKPPKDTPARNHEAEENLKQEARRRAAKSGVDTQTVERDLVARAEGNLHAVETEDMPGRALLSLHPARWPAGAPAQPGTPLLYRSVCRERVLAPSAGRPRGAPVDAGRGRGRCRPGVGPAPVLRTRAG